MTKPANLVMRTQRSRYWSPQEHMPSRPACTPRRMGPAAHDAHSKRESPSCDSGNVAGADRLMLAISVELLHGTFRGDPEGTANTGALKFRGSGHLRPRACSRCVGRGRWDTGEVPGNGRR